MMNYLIFNEGYESFVPSQNPMCHNPYNTVRQDDLITSLQSEATYFLNGWEIAKGKSKTIGSYSLFLDDFRFPTYSDDVVWIIARNYYEFIEWIIRLGLPKLITWDFDLDRHGVEGIKELPYGNGLDCAKWLSQYCKVSRLQFPNSVVHSSNPEGSALLEEFIKLQNESNIY